LANKKSTKSPFLSSVWVYVYNINIDKLFAQLVDRKSLRGL